MEKIFFYVAFALFFRSVFLTLEVENARIRAYRHAHATAKRLKRSLARRLGVS
jgi:hypothetical protein